MADETLAADADITDGSWLTDTGGTSLFAAIDESVASDTDYIVSGAPDTDTCEIGLANPSGVFCKTPFSVAYRYKRIGSDTMTLQVDLVEGEAISQTGSVLEFVAGSQTNTGTLSSTITVPSDAELVVAATTLATSGPIANYLTSGSVTFTKSGVDTAMTSVSSASDVSNYQGAMWYLLAPDTGSNKSLKWDWSGSATSDFPGVWTISFWKGINTTSPVRDGDAGQSGSLPYTTPTLTAQTGDLILAWAYGYTPTSATVDTWTNLTELYDTEVNSALATGSPTGNTTVAAATGTNLNEGGIVAVVLKPASGGGAVRASWDVAVTNDTFADAEQFLTAPEFAAITDFTDLRVRFTAIRAAEDALTLEGDFSGDLTLEGDFSGSLLLEGS